MIDGLAWLWRTWQETAPKPPPNRGNSAAASPTYSQILNSGRLQVQPPASVQQDSVNDDVSNRLQCLPVFNNLYFCFKFDDDSKFDDEEAAAPVFVPGGGQLISAAIGVTRAISSFLGSALQVNLDRI